MGDNGPSITASMVKLVDTADLKSAALNRRTGSIPVRGTNSVLSRDGRDASQSKPAHSGLF